MKSRNENFAVCSFFTPWNIPVEIVIPERETPGKSAKICINPIIKEFFKFIFLVDIFGSLVRSRIRPVKIKVMPITRYEEKDDPIVELKKYPKVAAGIVASIK